MRFSPSESPKAPLIALVGPTASGKSDVAVELALLLADEGWRCEILSADSMQVYRHMDIGTAMPDAAARRRVRHHLLDVVEPTQVYNVSLYQQQASGILEQLLREGKGAVVVGGTGLYVKALVDGLNRAPAAQPELRKRLEEEVRSRGTAAVYERLRQVDPKAAERIHPNNIRRMVRALEVYELSGKPLSAFHKEQDQPAWRERFVWRGLRLPWKELDRRIAARTNKMFEQGLVEEVRQLLRMGCGPEHTAMQGLGYKEVAQGLAEGRPEAEIKALVEQRTRRYARRQMTWWRPERRVAWLDVAPGESAREVARRLLQSLPDSPRYGSGEGRPRRPKGAKSP